MTQFTTIKEYDNAVRASQRKLKRLHELNNSHDGNPQDFAELQLAQAGHKFLLASRAKFKETGVSAPQLRDVQALTLDEAMSEPVSKEWQDFAAKERAKRQPTAAEPQAPTPIDRAREFVPSARVIRERAHAGAMRAHKFAPNDSRAQGLGYKSCQRRAEQKRRVMSLGITPKFPAMRDSTCFLMRNSSRRILVNGLAW